MMQAHNVDEELWDWIMPGFPTTAENDEIVTSVVFMGMMSKYFDYGEITGMVCRPLR